MSIVGPCEFTPREEDICEASLHYNRLEVFEGGGGCLAKTELLMMGKDSIKVPKDTLGVGGS